MSFSQMPNQPGVAMYSDDKRMERTVSAVLRVGLYLSVLLVFFGLTRSLSESPGSIIGGSTASAPVGEPSQALRESLSGIRSLNGRSLITLGLLVLIATPAARVGVSLACFAARRDWIYTTVTGIVLALLILSVVVGRIN